jgi:hypothetical protein
VGVTDSVYNILIALPDKFVPVCYAADHQANKDVVEGLSPSPFLLGIVDLKGAVGRDTETSIRQRPVWSKAETHNSGCIGAISIPKTYCVQ